MSDFDPVIKAIEERLWTHTVGIVNRAIERTGRDPLGTHMRGIQYGDPGTAFAGLWGKQHFLGTAKHVLEEAEVKDLLFFPRNVGDLKKEPASQVKMENAFEPVSLRDETATIHRCEWDDLAVITIAADALGTFVEFFDISNESSDPAENDALIGMGYPMSSSIIFQKQQAADPVERAIVLSPTPFSGVVLPSTRGRFFKDFDPDRHVLIEYDPAKEGHHPSGISGAAVWTRHEKRKDLWSVTVEFAGVCTSCYSDGKVEQIVKASAVCQFLTECFGTA
jgi:hypothetical protein